jgi:hypothetical protein
MVGVGDGSSVGVAVTSGSGISVSVDVGRIVGTRRVTRTTDGCGFPVVVGSGNEVDAPVPVVAGSSNSMAETSEILARDRSLIHIANNIPLAKMVITNKNKSHLRSIIFLIPLTALIATGGCSSVL